MKSAPAARSSTEDEYQIRANIEIHDQVAPAYDQRHGEIFNDIEQQRLGGTLARARDLVRSAAEPLRALDVGCGSGNLTRHLAGLGFQVVAADVSEQFLKRIGEQFPSSTVSTHKLNGKDLGGLADQSFDFVGAYSVLHHIPDYLGGVMEMARVCRPGGVVYLDHEPTDDYWAGDPVYAKFKAAASRRDWRKYLVWNNYVGKVRRLFNPRYTNEGDIHVWPDDHIEWNRIEAALAAVGFEVVLREDYLLYRRGYVREVYEQYRELCTDIRVLAMRKC